MGYRLNRLNEPGFMAVSKPMQTEFGIHHRLESSAPVSFYNNFFRSSYFVSVCIVVQECLFVLSGILNLRNNRREDPDGGSLRTETESPRTLTNVVSTSGLSN